MAQYAQIFTDVRIPNEADFMSNLEKCQNYYYYAKMLR